MDKEDSIFPIFRHSKRFRLPENVKPTFATLQLIKIFEEQILIRRLTHIQYNQNYKFEEKTEVRREKGQILILDIIMSQ